MKTSVSHLSRWFLVVLMLVVCVIALSAQGAGGFRVYREWNFSLVAFLWKCSWKSCGYI